jgi:hypothetical protein
MAARGFSRANGKEFTRPRDSTLAANGRPFTGNVRGDPPLRAAPLARIRPTQLGLWSFVVAIAHGAGLMLVPIYLGPCRAADLDKGHEAANMLISANLGMAVLVSVIHSVAMIAAGGVLAWLVFRYLVASSCRGAGSIWKRLGPSASSWWAPSRLRSAWAARAENHIAVVRTRHRGSVAG